MPVFISYSHDSPAHEQRVLALANRLRGDGIDCHVDAFEEAPPEGWPNWMLRQVDNARYVLVVCTATYHRRVSGRERPGVGLGARWEGALITQSVYEGAGQNEKFIPVVLESGDVEEIPVFLRSTTRYDLSARDGYDRLYRRLTQQPRVVKPPLGSIRNLPPEHPTGSAAPAPRRPGTKSGAGGPRAAKNVVKTAAATRRRSSPRTTPTLLLIADMRGQGTFVPLASIEERENITAVVVPETSAERVFLESLQQRRNTTGWIAFGLTALRARLLSVSRTFEHGHDRFTLTFERDGPSFEGSISEISTSGYSADDIAALRARRILLDERPPAPAGRSWPGDGSMLDVLILGMSSGISVERSPLLALYRQISTGDRDRFVAAARLTGVLWVRMTQTVEHVLELNMSLRRGGLAVHFRGVRHRVFSNREPAEIRVEGVCPLESSGSQS